jgi:hypothetical protein
LLGVKIDKNLKNLQTNFDRAKVNMQKIVNFWSRFNLSLTGRINVAKCFLLSQVNYLGCIINPDPPTLLWMQNLINKFCTGPLRIALEKLYLPPAKGGLGLISLRDTLTAQQAIWFKRALVSSRDNWRWDLWQAGCRNCLTPDLDLLGTLTNPILYNLTLSMRQFLSKFYTKENNFLDSYVLNNPCITVQNGFPYPLNVKFWNSTGNTNLFILSRLRIRDFLANNRLKPFVELNNTYNINITFTTYIRLTGIINRAVSQFITRELSCTTVEKFFSTFKKGSKAVRNILTGSATCTGTVARSFSEVANFGLKCEDDFRNSLGIWGMSCLPNNFREFLFKFYHNRLGLNTRIAHFTENMRWCTFCDKVGNSMGPFDDETFVHLFLTCPSVRKLHSDIANIMLEGLEITRQNWLGLELDNFFLKIFLLAIQYFIWEAKLKKQIPVANYCLGEAVYLLRDSMALNKKIRNSFANLHCPLSRLWTRLTSTRW